ncbi:MAG: sugar nucleotide-binding protein [Alphaproteobacteria bacterium]|nr:sugar nucleotide-binding protein [Alphaproteobacteria bacterium]
MKREKNTLFMYSNYFPIFLTGGRGLFGSVFLKKNKKIKKQILAPSSSRLDITKKKEISQYLNKYMPKLIIHAAALVGIADCEKNKLLCKRINIEGTRNICSYAKKNNIRFIYISTDYVFDGKKGNYSENDKPNPKSIYGKSKLSAENIVKSLNDYLIIRTSFFSRKKWKYKEAFVDQYTSRIQIEELISKINKIIFTKFSGLIHIAGKRQSLYNIARKIDKKTKPISLKDHKDLNIPEDISLNINKWNKLLKK